MISDSFSSFFFQEQKNSSPVISESIDSQNGYSYRPFLKIQLDTMPGSNAVDDLSMAEKCVLSYFTLIPNH
jgi:hypothetical protein